MSLRFVTRPFTVSPRSVKDVPRCRPGLKPVYHGSPGCDHGSPRGSPGGSRSYKYGPIFSFWMSSSLTSDEYTSIFHTTFNMPGPGKGKRATSKPPVPGKKTTNVKHTGPIIPVYSRTTTVAPRWSPGDAPDMPVVPRYNYSLHRISIISGSPRFF